MIYVILGAHKSGTTLISQILHHSGINMVDEYRKRVSYDRGNFYERKTTKAINKNIIEYESHSIFGANIPERTELTAKQRQRIQEVIQTCSKKYVDWGFKDPRTCLIYHLWEKELPPHKIIVIYRSPAETWQRYQRRRYPAPCLAWKYTQKWCESNESIIGALQKTKMDFIVLNYQKFVTENTQIEQLQEFIGMELVDCRNIKMYRHQPKESNAFKLGTWLADKQLGLHPDRIMAQLEAMEGTGSVLARS